MVLPSDYVDVINFPMLFQPRVLSVGTLPSRIYFSSLPNLPPMSQFFLRSLLLENPHRELTG